MSNEEAMAELDRIMEISPAESYSKEAEEKAARLFAVLAQMAKEKDEVQAGMIITHPIPFVKPIARRYETELREESKNE